MAFRMDVLMIIYSVFFLVDWGIIDSIKNKLLGWEEGKSEARLLCTIKKACT